MTSAAQVPGERKVPCSESISGELQLEELKRVTGTRAIDWRVLLLARRTMKSYSSKSYGDKRQTKCAYVEKKKVHITPNLTIVTFIYKFFP